MTEVSGHLAAWGFFLGPALLYGIPVEFVAMCPDAFVFGAALMGLGLGFLVDRAIKSL